MKAWTTVARASGLEGQELVLQERDGVFVIRSGGRELMSSVRHHSEREMARIGLKGLGKAKSPRVLIGGLGLGYTARATLELLPSSGRVTVAEISPAVVEWNRAHLGHLAGHPLDDLRTEVATADVADVMRQRPGGFDCILLDVDLGPSAMAAKLNQQLYEVPGIATMKQALRPGGVVVIWSAGPDAGFLKRLGKSGFHARVEKSTAHESGGTQHVLFIAKS